MKTLREEIEFLLGNSNGSDIVDDLVKAFKKRLPDKNYWYGQDENDNDVEGERSEEQGFNQAIDEITKLLDE